MKTSTAARTTSDSASLRSFAIRRSCSRCSSGKYTCNGLPDRPLFLGFFVIAISHSGAPPVMTCNDTTDLAQILGRILGLLLTHSLRIGDDAVSDFSIWYPTSRPHHAEATPSFALRCRGHAICRRRRPVESPPAFHHAVRRRVEDVQAESLRQRKVDNPDFPQRDG